MHAKWSHAFADCHSKHAPACWDAFKIPQALLSAPHAVQSSALSVLPTELLLKIFAHANAFEQLFLALTCKRLLAVYSMTTMIIPSAPKHRSVPSLNCSAMLRLIYVMQPLEKHGYPKKNWAPCLIATGIGRRE
ncbi:uncharacterized protein BCR38DRAFT_448246 [Pseudomassariella vexata]|uniref:F-box domain-containing protein n=1 Tax=Pseudomassariella vexata TaxID=1141098 RepID=A0A1Y2DHD9_9PEZI|nr:uncharacterized protein BCR38DRAFT_448246 [Pseudomassariella vexata]ORY58155.1 hypothetical protein BCR38DRAFT_448246 [Pseudomassariella vexata]